MEPKKGSDNSKSKIKVVGTTIKMKEDLITKYENGVHECNLATQFCLAKSMICTTLNNEEAIKEADVAKGVKLCYFGMSGMD